MEGPSTNADAPRARRAWAPWVAIALLAAGLVHLVVNQGRTADESAALADRLAAMEARIEALRAETARTLDERLTALDEAHVGKIDDLATRVGALHAEQARLVSRKEVDALREGMRVHTQAVERMLAEDDALRRVLEHFRRGVGLVYGQYSFHVRVGKELKPATLGGRPIRLEFSGTGFLASKDGHVVTNRHVVRPWVGNPDVRPFIARGLVGRLDRVTITFPGKRLLDVDKDTIRLSPDVDVAIFQVEAPGVPVLPLSEKDALFLRGRRVTVLGYPTGIQAMLARAEPDEVEQVLREGQTAFELLDALAAARMISPVITQGTVNDIRSHRIVYDALTTSGGSGGPVFGPDGTVAGVNFAVTRGFGGANFGVPILFARELLGR